MSIEEVLSDIHAYQVKDVLLTGGEPLLQRGAIPLAQALAKENYTVSVETHGEACIQAMSPHARIIMDIKTPGSKMSRGGYVKNIPFLKKGDEIKFVITSQEDYQWSKRALEETPLPSGVEVLFSPVIPAMDARWLADSIIRDRLNVRFQLQLHKQIWGNQRGV